MTHPGYGAQWPPPVGPVASSGTTGRAYRWFVAYVAVTALVFLVGVIGGLFLLITDFVYDTGSTPAEIEEVRASGAVMLAVCLPLLAVFVVGFFLPRRPWSWVYGLVLICLGLTSCITWPITIPLLIQWLKPEMKARFGHR